MTPLPYHSPSPTVRADRAPAVAGRTPLAARDGRPCLNVQKVSFQKVLPVAPCHFRGKSTDRRSVSLQRVLTDRRPMSLQRVLTVRSVSLQKVLTLAPCHFTVALCPFRGFLLTCPKMFIAGTTERCCITFFRMRNFARLHVNVLPKKKQYDCRERGRL